jgi:hypothetical protein
VLDRDGVAFPERFGQPKPRPEVAIERDSRVGATRGPPSRTSGCASTTSIRRSRRPSNSTADGASSVDLPASTLLGVARLAFPQLKVEVEATTAR